jgi:hypothetical protein
MVEELALFVERLCLCQTGRVDAVDAGEQVGGGDEAAEQAGLVNIAVEDGDAAAAERAAVPVVARGVVEMRRTRNRSIGVAELEVSPDWPRQKSRIRSACVGKMPEGCELQLVERNMVRR